MADTTVHANGGHIIKHLRKKAKITQKQLAEKLFMSQVMLSKIENGEHDLDFIDFKDALDICGVQTQDYWLVTLTVDEFEGFLLYKEMKTHFANGGKFQDEKAPMYHQLMISPLAKKIFVQQFLSCIQVHRDEALLSSEQKLNILYASLYKSLKNFTTENAHAFLFTYEEAELVYEIANIYVDMGDDVAVTLLKSIIGNEENLHMTNEDKFSVLPKTRIGLAKAYINQQQYSKALAILEKQKSSALVRMDRVSYIAPLVAYYQGICHHKMGKDENIYMPSIKMAYYAAAALKQTDLMANIEKEYGTL